GASSFTTSSTTLQVNLGSGGTVFDGNSSPQVNAGDSIWLGTFVVNTPPGTIWQDNTSTNPGWTTSGTSVSVYNAGCSLTTAIVCSRTGNATSCTAGLLQDQSNGGVAP